MKAQILYDFREEWEFCSGTELADFFSEQVGNPSPGGDTEISGFEAGAFIVARCHIMAHNAPSLTEHAINTMVAWWSTGEPEPLMF